MLIFLRHDLAYLATPKTGTTAIEMALKPRAEIIFAKNRKHTTAARYANKVAPFLQDTFGVRPASVAVMRKPVEQIRSWYRYRSQKRLNGTPQSTRDISFDQFVREVISDDPPARAQIGRQFSFLTDGQGRIMVNHLFSYANREDFLMFLSERLQFPVEPAEKNISPDIDAALGDDTLALLRAARSEDFALYDQIMAQGGHLETPEV
ncbi:hypothetical protein AB2B41_15340 [Marimonas sp. MJW-29]|uniref:Gamma-glutamyl kinase n=1 Tax=Sulfitobacter sediminis TaxID=3234186 RepID=A0ABV3RQP3_9RHOB